MSSVKMTDDKRDLPVIDKNEDRQPAPYTPPPFPVLALTNVRNKLIPCKQPTFKQTTLEMFYQSPIVFSANVLFF